MSSNDLWPPWKTIGIIYTPRATNILSLKFRWLSLLEISCLQGFQTLTSGDLKWPLTAMENNRDHLRTKGYQQTKFEVQATFTCWDTVFTRFPVFDLWWPQMTFDLHENNRDHLPTKGYQHTKFEVQATFTSWDIVFTSKASHTHTHTHTRTHTHTPSPSHRFLWPSARNQKSTNLYTSNVFNGKHVYVWLFFIVNNIRLLYILSSIHLFENVIFNIVYRLICIITNIIQH